jgi:hypothetical protein
MGREDPAASADSNDNGWKELAERLLHLPYPGGSPLAVEVLLRRLPDDVPANVPVPTSWRLLGSKTYGQVGRPWGLEAVFDAHGAGSELLGGYETLVKSRGWSVYRDARVMPAAFTSGLAVAPSREFRVDGEGPILRIIVGGREHMPADIRLRIDWETPRRMPSRPHRPLPSMERMPVLQSPVGVPLAPDASGGAGEHRGYWYATAETDMPVADLAAHLASQLVEIGWTRIVGNRDDTTWSSWRLPGEGGWRGLLLVLEAFAPNERSLFLQVEAGQPDDE